MKNASQVELELKHCHARVMYDNITVIEENISKGALRVTSDPLLKKAFYDFNENDKVVHEENLECILHEKARLKESLPPEDQRPLNDFERFQYDGAISASLWLMGHINEELIGCLISGRLKVEDEIGNNLVAYGARVMGNKQVIAAPFWARKDNGCPAISRRPKKIEQELSRLQILHRLELYKVLKSQIEDGVAVITTDPGLKEGQLHLGDETLVHVDYWESLKEVLDLAKSHLPKKLLNGPPDVVLAGRVDGAIGVLDWLLSEENDPLATFLKFDYPTRKGNC